MRNETALTNGSVEVALVGTVANRTGVGAKVSVTHNGRCQIAEVYAGRGYKSHYGTRLHFGLGPIDRTRTVVIDNIEVDWGPGGIENFRDVETRVGQVVQLIQGDERSPGP